MDGPREKLNVNTLSALADAVEARTARLAEVAEALGPHVKALLTADAENVTETRERDAAIVRGAADAKALGRSLAGLVAMLGYRGDTAKVLRPKLARHWLVAEGIHGGHLSVDNAASLIRQPDEGGGLRAAVKFVREATDDTTPRDRAATAVRHCATAISALLNGKEDSEGNVLFQVGDVIAVLAHTDSVGGRAELASYVTRLGALLGRVLESAEVETADVK